MCVYVHVDERGQLRAELLEANAGRRVREAPGAFKGRRAFKGRGIQQRDRGKAMATGTGSRWRAHVVGAPGVRLTVTLTVTVTVTLTLTYVVGSAGARLDLGRGDTGRLLVRRIELDHD